MKVVIFCGGLGIRMGEATQRIPKPMIAIGTRPILWHIMKYYASWGHTDFVLCLGFKGETVKDYFLNYDEALTNDFVLSNGGKQVEILSTDTHDWRISFVDTGLQATIGDRLRAVARFIGDDPVFLATYGDGLTDAPLPRMIATLEASAKTAMFMAVRPSFNCHVIEADDGGRVTSVEDIKQAPIWINGGFFVFRREILDYIEPGDELVEQPFRRLIEADQLLAYRHEGFWAPMDTLKDKQRLEALFESGSPPWRVAAAGEPGAARS